MNVHSQTRLLDLGKEFNALQIVEILEAVSAAFDWSRSRLIENEIHRDVFVSVKRVAEDMPVFQLEFRPEKKETGHTVHAFSSKIEDIYIEIMFFVINDCTKKISQLRFSYSDGKNSANALKKVDEFLLNVGIACLLYESK